MDIVNVDSFGSTTTWDKHVCTAERVQVELISELETVIDNFSTGQSHVPFINQNTETPELNSQYWNYKSFDVSGPSAIIQLIQALGIVNYTTSINNRNCAVLGNFDLIRTQIAIRATGLELAALLLLQSKFTINSGSVLMDGRVVMPKRSCGIPPRLCDFPVVKAFQKEAPRLRACKLAQSMKSAVPSSGPKNKISFWP